MPHYISKGNIFGRIGSGLGEGIGRGLSEQIPKEVDRNRLASGLQQFEQEHQNMSPIQQLARLSAIPGVTPQMIQSFSELAKQNNLRNAYKRGGHEQASPSASPSRDFRQMEMGPTQRREPQQPMPSESQRTPPVSPREYSPPQVVNENPLQEKYEAKLPWKPDQKFDRINQYLSQGFTPEQSKQLADEDQATEQSTPDVYKQRREELKGYKKEAQDALQRHLETKLHKRGDELFKDVTGDMQIAAQRGMERDLRLNPKASVDDVANDWSNRLKNIAEVKGRLKKLAATTGPESLFQGQKVVKNLKEYQRAFAEADDLKEFYNILRSDLGMSAGGAASSAYPLSKSHQQYISDVKSRPITPGRERGDNSRKYAMEIEELGLNERDSILSIARALKMKDANFDEQAFFDQISEDQDRIGLPKNLKDELQEGVQSLFPSWGDVKYTNIFG